jgi:hypothetical protein
MNKKIITDTEIIDDLSQTDIVLEKLSIEDVFSLIPLLVRDMESKYGRLRGSEKRRLLIATVVCIMKKFNCSEDDIKFVYVILPNLIDSIVKLSNEAGSLFNKIKKKRCFGFCSKTM